MYSVNNTCQIFTIARKHHNVVNPGIICRDSSRSYNYVALCSKILSGQLSCQQSWTRLSLIISGMSQHREISLAGFSISERSTKPFHRILSCLVIKNSYTQMVPTLTNENKIYVFWWYKQGFMHQVVVLYISVLQGKIKHDWICLQLSKYFSA